MSQSDYSEIASKVWGFAKPMPELNKDLIVFKNGIYSLKEGKFVETDMKKCEMRELNIKGLILHDVEKIIDTRFKQIKKNEMFKKSFAKWKKQNKERKNHER